MRTVIKVDHVTKVFGDETVLKDVSFEFYEGLVYGIVGNNGSGKTVLMKCICGFLNPTSGDIYVNYKRIGKDVDFPDDIGIIIETPGFLPNMTGLKNLELLASLKNKIGKKQIVEAIEAVGLDPKLKSTYPNILSVCASVSVLHRLLWRIPSFLFWASRLTVLIKRVSHRCMS